MADILQQVETARLRDDLPDFAPGDTVRVLYRVREGEKERIQAFEGVCIARRGGVNGATFTVRKVSSSTFWGELKKFSPVTSCRIANMVKKNAPPPDRRFPDGPRKAPLPAPRPGPPGPGPLPRNLFGHSFFQWPGRPHL